MQEVVKRIVPILRSLGFKGSGQTYRKAAGDYMFVINFQASRWGGHFFVNLGAQPTFAPAEGDADLAKLKEYECILRRRAGKEWPRDMSDQEFVAFQAEVVETAEAFFGHAQTLRNALAEKSPATLLDHYSAGTTRARATLHLARAAANLGHYQKARELVHRGLELAGEGASGLRIELNGVLASLPK